MDNKLLADILFPDVSKTVEDLEKRYPERNTKGNITRLGPSPTGFIHLENSECTQTGKSARRFRDFTYRTLDSWSCTRRVVGKAEQLPGKANPRFIVTSLDAQRWPARELYEALYCARGEMKNRIKECQLHLFADRTSTATMRTNQLQL